MNWHAPLWADAEWIGVVIFLVISALSVLGQFINKAGKRNPKAGSRRRAVRHVRPVRRVRLLRPLSLRAPPARTMWPTKSPIFFAAHRNEPKAEHPPRRARPVQPKRPAAGSVGRRREVRAEVVAEKAVRAEVVPEPPLGSEVGKHVAEHLGGQSFSRETAQLGTGVVKAEKQLEQHIQQVFERRVSTLAPRDARSAAPAESSKPASGLPPTAAAGFAALLASAASVRQAIILHEILTRPEDRWS